MAAKLKSLDKDLEFPLEDFNLIGRSPDASIRLLDGGVSRQHATIRRDGSLFWISDLGSANGTFVNDVAVTTARALRHGDRVQFGTGSFVFDNDEESGATGTHASSTQALHTIALPVKTVKATLLVGDLRNFTAISAQLSAEEVAAMLREWYAQCEQVLKSRGAVIDKFIGDGVFAYWHGTDAETRAKATEAARILSGPEAGETPKRKWLKDHMNLEVHCHIGLNIGDVALGAMGRGMTTAVGEAVNVTFRIESLTRKLQVPVLAGAPFLDGWQEGLSLYQNAGIHPVKGQPDPVEVYSLIDVPTMAL
ncbi:MAG: adenylate/guanylate cyclase domain-containing protein [Verrucomicrobiaceae bacterium]|jgi:adenylate cyclase|nr:adenylate/guanylate cyclase domain-containing protein [Verrucomicrobiaceae bacterium]